LQDNRKGLRRVARKLIEKAESGDLAAIKELADRTDGRSVQQNINQHELDAQKDMIIEVTIGGEQDCLKDS
ncbi:MAG: hypothetical protein ACR2O8_03495, partial [Rhizobiaceae bacterium]